MTCAAGEQLDDKGSVKSAILWKMIRQRERGRERETERSVMSAIPWKDDQTQTETETERSVQSVIPCNNDQIQTETETSVSYSLE